MTTARTFKLNNGKAIPAIGLGTWQSQTGGETRKAVAHASSFGLCLDGNEDEVGQGIKDSGVPREEIFITSKLFEHHHDPEMVPLAIEDTLKNLQTDYLDLYLIHWPSAIKPDPATPKGQLSRKWALKANGKPDTDYELSENHSATWQALEKLVEQGKVRAIGVSNFNIHRLRVLLKTAKIIPAANQIELSLQNPQFELVDWLQKKNIQAEAYSPLGSTGAKLIQNPTVVKLADKYKIDPAAIVVSWLIGRGVVVLPKSVTPSRIESNLKDVVLSKEEVEELNMAAAKVPRKRVCDQSDDFDFDIFEENHPENNDKVQASLA